MRGEDFKVPDSITVEAGQTTGSVTLKAIDDEIDEIDEVAFISSGGKTSNGVTIEDNDSPPVVSISPGQTPVTEGGTA